jgi:hypothetical protein
VSPSQVWTACAHPWLVAEKDYIRSNQTECTIQEWSQISEYRESLERIAGTDGPRRLEEQTIERMDDFRHYSKIIHRNFLKIAETHRSID